MGYDLQRGADSDVFNKETPPIGQVLFSKKWYLRWDPRIGEHFLYKIEEEGPVFSGIWSGE